MRINEDSLLLSQVQLKDYISTMMKRFNALSSYLFIDIENTTYSVLKILKSENVQCDPLLLAKLSNCVSLFDENVDESILIPLDVMTEHNIKNPYMRLKCLATVADVEELIGVAQAFLQPVQPFLEMLAFFKHQGSELFRLHLQNAKDMLLREVGNDSQTLTSTIFCKCLQRMKGFLHSVYEGTVTFKDLTCNEKLSMEMQIDNEIVSLQMYATRSEYISERLTGLKCIFDLRKFNYVCYIIETVCQQCEIKHSSDTNFKKLRMLCKEIKSLDWSEIDINQASDKMGNAVVLLHTDQTNAYDFLELFESVAESAYFIRFVKEKGFVGQEGQSYFMETYELVTAQLQHQDYPESVLNHLWGAFKLITPFMSPNKTYTELMASVAKLDKGRGVRELFMTVNQGINHIKLWFSKAEVKIIVFVNHHFTLIGNS